VGYETRDERMLPMSIADELLKLKSLLNEGAITQEEFAACKANLLAAPAESIDTPAPPPEPKPEEEFAEREIPAVQPPEEKPANKRKKFILLGAAAAGLLAIAVLVVVFGVLPNMTKNVIDMPFTIVWPVSDRESSAEGTYTGETKRKLPNGTGTFIIKHEDRGDYSLTGEWTNGYVNGYAEEVNGTYGIYRGEFTDSLYDGRGQCYNVDTEELYFDGDFEDNEPVNPMEFQLIRELGGQENFNFFLDMFVGGLASGSDVSYDGAVEFDTSYDADWRVTLRENSSAFHYYIEPPAKELDLSGANLVFKPPIKKVVDKPEAYRHQILCCEGEKVNLNLNLPELKEHENQLKISNDIFDGFSFFTLADKDNQGLYVVFCPGKINFKTGDTVAFAGVPFAIKQMTFNTNSKLNFMCFIACAVTDDMDKIKAAAKAGGNETEPATPAAGNNATGWREFLASYEEWVDDYNAFMTKYVNNPADLTLLADYANMIAKTAEWSEDAGEWEEDLSGAELAEFTQEYLRIMGKMMAGIAGLTQ